MTIETDSRWNNLYKIGGASALALVAYCLATMVVVFGVGGQPSTAQEIFEMLNANRLTGLLRLDVLTTFCMPLYYLVFLSIFVVLKKTHPVSAAITLLLGCTGVTLFLSAPAFTSWLTLSDKFAAATGEAQKSALLAAGEAVLSADMWHSTGVLVGGLLMQISTLVISLVMLRNNAFGRLTAWTGIVAHGLDVVHIVLLLFAPTIGMILMVISGTLYLAWFPLLARDFFRIGKK